MTPTMLEAVPVAAQTPGWWGRRPWLPRFLGGLGLWSATVVVTFATGNGNLVPTIILLGSFLVPVAFVSYALGHARPLAPGHRLGPPAAADSPPAGHRGRGTAMSRPCIGDLRGRGRFPRPQLLVLVVLAGVLVLTGCTTTTASSSATATGLDVKPSAVALQEQFVQVVKQVGPSVVLIQTSQGLGSGIVFDAKGDVVTNNHVVDNAGGFQVTLADGRQHPARLVGSFAADDLAVLHIDAEGLQPAGFADSSSLQVGDVALAIGNPLGLQSSVTEGIVSALGRTVNEDNGVALPNVIQTSAAINPGNSGGALVDLQGQVIGIPTLAATDPQLGGTAAPGIGFAIPSNIVRDVAAQLIGQGKVTNSHRAWLGVEVAATTSDGLLVTKVQAGGPAAKAGIRAGELITAVDGTATPDPGTLADVLAGLQPGQSVAVTVAHPAGARQTLRVTLGHLPG